jgi:hypothetical protein
MMQTIIGIDNGLSGGLCVLNRATLEIIALAAMPCKPYGFKNEIDVDAVLKWVQQFPEPTVAIEEPLHFAPTLASMRSMALSFGKIVGACTVLQVPCIRVQVKDWQDAILGVRKIKGLTKSIALAKATQRWPKQRWCVGRSKTPHDGIIDAALIAVYANENIVLEPRKPARRVKTPRARKVARKA